VAVTDEQLVYQLYCFLVCPEALAEFEFMDWTLLLLRAGIEQPIVRLTEEQLAEIENERPGEEFSHYPFWSEEGSDDSNPR
jgi:hypothetical protein